MSQCLWIWILLDTRSLNQNTIHDTEGKKKLRSMTIWFPWIFLPYVSWSDRFHFIHTHKHTPVGKKRRIFTVLLMPWFFLDVWILYSWRPCSTTWTLVIKVQAMFNFSHPIPPEKAKNPSRLKVRLSGIPVWQILNHQSWSSCGVCGKMFAYRHGLIRHMNTHQATAHSSFACHLCGRNFNRSDSLRRHHRLIHDHMKPSTEDH